MVVLSQEEKEVAKTFLDESERVSDVQDQTAFIEEMGSPEFNSLCDKVLQKVLSQMPNEVQGNVHPRIFTFAYGAIKPVDGFHPLLIGPSINMLHAFHDTVRKMVDGDSWEDAKGDLPSMLVTYLAKIQNVMNQVPGPLSTTQKRNLCGNA